MSDPEKTIQDFVATFIAAWPARDAGKVASLFAEDAVYHNMPIEPVKGREAIKATLATMMELGGRVEVDIAHLVVGGSVVMTERVDRFITPDKTVTLPVMGTFEVHDGMITAWRDYFDLNQFTSQMTDPA
jgi:limonene-1,2-epoxide hydrolase